MSRKQINREYITITKKLDIPENKLSKYKDSFNKFDKESSGTLSVVEVQKIMRNFGYPMKREEVQQMINEVDSNKDGKIDFDEFVMLMEDYMSQLGEDPVIKAFIDYDKNGDGKITIKEFKYILTHFGNNPITQKEADDLFSNSGLSDKADIDYEDFLLFWRNNMK